MKRLLKDERGILPRGEIDEIVWGRPTRSKKRPRRKRGRKRLALPRGVHLTAHSPLRRTITVRRKAYERKGYRKDIQPGPGVKMGYIQPTKVKATEYEMIDLGAPGRGRKVVKRIAKGLMTRKAIEYGILRPGQKVGSLSKEQIQRLALGLAKDPEIGPAKARRMFAVQAYTFRKRMPDGFKEKMIAGHEAIVEKYERELAPWPAIRAWKRMSPRARARAMPGR